LVKELCERKRDFIFVQTASVLIGKDNKPNDSLFISDRLLLNSEGYSVWNQLIKTELIRTKEVNSL